MIISYDYGHMMGGEDGSAIGIVNEYTEVRNYGSVVVNELIRQGHTLVNCTPANGYMSLGDSLSFRVNKANISGSQLHLCFHANAFNSQAHGAECEVASDNSARYGQSILNEIVKLGFTNRGINRPALYVTKNTSMACVLIEPFFCDSDVDVALYNCNTLGKAIAQGVINVIGGNPIIEEKKEEKELKKIVVYLGDADVFAALMVSQKNQCPLMSKQDFESSGIKADQVIPIGGKNNSTRFTTFKDAANLL